MLGNFNKEKNAAMKEPSAKAVRAVELMLTEGADAAMNEFNRKVPAADSRKAADLPAEK